MSKFDRAECERLIGKSKTTDQGHISISAATHARLKAYCAERGIPMSQLVAAIAIKHVVDVERAQRRAARSIPKVADALRRRYP